MEVPKESLAQELQHSLLPPQTLLPPVCVGNGTLKHMLSHVNTHTLHTHTHTDTHRQRYKPITQKQTL